MACPLDNAVEPTSGFTARLIGFKVIGCAMLMNGWMWKSQAASLLSLPGTRVYYVYPM
jgi:hypothetical protein